MIITLSVSQFSLLENEYNCNDFICQLVFVRLRIVHCMYIVNLTEICNFTVIAILVISATTQFVHKNAQEGSKGQMSARCGCDFVRPSTKYICN